MVQASSLRVSSSAVYRVEVSPRDTHGDAALVAALRDAGLENVQSACESRIYLIEGGVNRDAAERLAADLLADVVTEDVRVASLDNEIDEPAGARSVEVHFRPGVMDPVALSVLAELRAEGFAVDSVRTARRIVVTGAFEQREFEAAARRVLSNDCIEELVSGTAGVRPSPRPPVFAFALRTVALRTLDDAALMQLSRSGHLFLSLSEMHAIQAHYRTLQRDPTDLELETLAQTWSEHCVHKTLKSAVVYRGAPFPDSNGNSVTNPDETVHATYSNLLKDTIARATSELRAAGRGPECLSVFVDNAGVIGFDDETGVAFKVETHNRPSAIEPYGGAATGVGGCIRDVLGCGLGAKPIANTDVFCVAPGAWPLGALPRGVLHPARVLRGVVRGVADYGNRMGIPTVNGAIHFDPRYLGNPLVFCGCVGLIPRDKVQKQVQAGDQIVVIGGRTGRDGIHGATFSSAELTDTHADEFSSAVQIGNAIAEKRVLDALLRARDHADGCLYSAVTDCGAGGLSSAVGEMAAETGARVDLERVPLKYAGLRYDEIWISEAQERMVLSVPIERLAALLSIMEQEEVEAAVIGTFGLTGADGAPLLRVRYAETVVGELDMRFLHDGLPRRDAQAEWRPARASAAAGGKKSASGSWWEELRQRLCSPSTASKEWAIRSYDHEVQGGSVVKPLGGPGKGPNDAAVLRPRLNSSRGIAVGCGLAPHLSDIDPYWMACNAIDEAIRNVVCVGGDPLQTAILDNFCWGRCDDPQTMGALVRACQACYDAALAYGTPFISGKDSLNNEYLLHEDDVEPLLQTIAAIAAGPSAPPEWVAELPAIGERIRRTRRLAIPHTLLISALALVPDVAQCVTAALKSAGSKLLLVGGLPQTSFDLRAAAATHAAVAELIASGEVRACHDVSEGGWLVSVAEMAVAGHRGVALMENPARGVNGFEAVAAGYLLEVEDVDVAEALLAARSIRSRRIGIVRDDRRIVDAAGADVGSVEELSASWREE